MTNNSLHLELTHKPTSLKDMAVKSIRRAIFEGKFTPDVIYSEVVLAKNMGISKTPVREALIDLACKELLVHEPRKGFRIRQLNIDEVKNLFDYREALETAIVARVVPKITSNELHRLEEILSGDIRQNEDQDKFLDSIMIDRLFHLGLAELCRNPYFLNALSQVRDLCDLAGVWSLRTAGRTDEARKEHNLLFSMIKERSVEGAIDKMKDHLKATCQRVLENLGAKQI